ncbi:MAG: hypothetical protein LBG84_04380 [Treponema sp.]|jgi:F0F1-type ATP synthase membrane subunit b/b'|nr:hypothetical protein [Treponema sp.]
MEDTALLQHLLEIESQAVVLVDEAQAEADRRVREAEEKNRAFYDEQYQALIKELEADYEKQLEAVKAEYEATLTGCRRGLDDLSVNQEAFSALAASLLFAPSGTGDG